MYLKPSAYLIKTIDESQMDLHLDSKYWWFYFRKEYGLCMDIAAAIGLENYSKSCGILKKCFVANTILIWFIFWGTICSIVSIVSTMMLVIYKRYNRFCVSHLPSPNHSCLLCRLFLSFWADLTTRWAHWFGCLYLLFLSRKTCLWSIYIQATSTSTLHRYLLASAGCTPFTFRVNSSLPTSSCSC